MAEPPRTIHHPSLRSLRKLRGVRRELTVLYTEAKAGLHEAALVGRLVHCLNTIQAMDNGSLLEERLSAIEQKLGITKTNGNSHARPVTSPPITPSHDGLPLR
jgi:hypothetical protein